MIIHRFSNRNKFLNLYIFNSFNYLNILKKNNPTINFTIKQTIENTNLQKIKIKANNIKNRKVFKWTVPTCLTKNSPTKRTNNKGIIFFI